MPGSSSAPYSGVDTTRRTVATPRVLEESVGRRKADAPFVCPFDGCAQTFTAKHNLDCESGTHNEIPQPLMTELQTTSSPTTTSVRTRARSADLPSSGAAIANGMSRSGVSATLTLLQELREFQISHLGQLADASSAR
jgi:hypothetical protein